MSIPDWAQAAFWGLVAGSALVLGAVVGYYVRLPHRTIASVMGFGSGVLISVLALELVEESFEHGGLGPTALGLAIGAVIYSTADWFLSKRGAADRKRCGSCVAQPTEQEAPGSGLALAVGSLIDGVPESIIVGLSLITGGVVSTVAIVGFFLANFPEGLSSAAGMQHAGRSPGYVFGLWGGIALVSGVAAWLGYAVFGGLSEEAIATTGAIAAGGLLALVAETMIPEAFAEAPEFIGLITTAGFLVAFVLSRY